jgi:hypothetical protein
MLNCVIDLWQLCRSFAIAIQRLSLVKADNVWASALCFAFVEVCLAWKDSVKGAYHRKPERHRDSQDHHAEFDSHHGEVEARTVQISMTLLDTSDAMHGGDSPDSSLGEEVMSEEARRP